MSTTHKRGTRSESVMVFLRHNRRAAAVIGAFIVFLTFVVKDAIRENVKDLVDGLQSAQDVFEIRAQHEISVSLLNGIAQRVEMIWGTTAEGLAFLRRNDQSGVIGDITANADGLQQAKANLDNLRRFIDRLPTTETAPRAAVKDLEVRWKQLDDTYLKTIAAINSKKLSEDDEFGASVDLGTARETLQLDVGNLSDDVIARSDELKERAERTLKTYTWISYFLYSIGWSLALFGRLFDLDLVAE
jgi:hypothetical protein